MGPLFCDSIRNEFDTQLYVRISRILWPISVCVLLTRYLNRYSNFGNKFLNLTERSWTKYFENRRIRLCNLNAWVGICLQQKWNWNFNRKLLLLNWEIPLKVMKNGPSGSDSLEFHNYQFNFRKTNHKTKCTFYSISWIVNVKLDIQLKKKKKIHIVDNMYKLISDSMGHETAKTNVHKLK